LDVRWFRRSDALRKNGLDVVAIHHHMTQTQPTIFFLHDWGTGPVTSWGLDSKRRLRNSHGHTLQHSRSHGRGMYSEALGERFYLDVLGFTRVEKPQSSRNASRLLVPL
jgi:hypothetical protein